MHLPTFKANKASRKMSVLYGSSDAKFMLPINEVIHDEAEDDLNRNSLMTEDLNVT